MARMAGLWSFTCVLPPEEAPDHDEWGDSTEETEQPGTSYDSRSSASSGKSKDSSSRGSGEFSTRRSRDHHRLVNCYSGGAHMLACFRAGAINLIVHPALQVSTSTTGAPHRPGASTVQPVNTLPRASFLDVGAAAEDSGDEPTSPVVTCIGQVRKDKPRTPPAKPVVADAVGGPDLMRLKSTKRGKPQLPRSPSSPAARPLPRSPSSPAARPSKWRQILGGHGTSSVQQPHVDEFHVDLSRFSSADVKDLNRFSSVDVKAVRRTPGTGAFLAKSLMLLQMERGGGDGDDDEHDGKLANKGTTANMMASWHDGKPVSKGAATDEALLWKRRSGAKPLMLDLKRQLD